MSRFVSRLVFAVVGFTAAAAALAASTLHATGNLTVLCPLTVGGSFEAKGQVEGDLTAPDASGAVGGSVRVALDGLKTGIALRDHHMTDNYLEVGKGDDYRVAVLDQIRLERPAGKASFHARLRLHGQTREIAGVATVRAQHDTTDVEAEFPLKVSAFGIPKPTYLGVGVRDEIRISVALHAGPR